MLFLTLSSLFVASVSALSASSIDSCPTLEPRSQAPTNVSDLRPDDIKVIAAMGDSIMAGALMMGTDGPPIIGALTEYRGESYAIGGNQGATTIAKFVQRYSPTVKGASIGQRIGSTCGNDPECSSTTIYRPLRDRLNGAISGAVARNLDRELDYLIPRMKDMLGANFENHWKLITIQIGSNDQCASCAQGDVSDYSVEKYGEYVSAAVDRIKQNVPRVIVNILGVFNVSQVYTLTQSVQDQQNSTLLNRQMCGCFQGDDTNRTHMDTLVNGYNDKLVEIYNKYSTENDPNFAVLYQPANIDILGFPIEALNNIDYFHPSKITHQWIAKRLWGDLFVPSANKTGTWEFDANQSIYCPTEDDRIRLD